MVKQRSSSQLKTLSNISLKIIHPSKLWWCVCASCASLTPCASCASCACDSIALPFSRSVSKHEHPSFEKANPLIWSLFPFSLSKAEPGEWFDTIARQYHEYENGGALMDAAEVAAAAAPSGPEKPDLKYGGSIFRNDWLFSLFSLCSSKIRRRALRQPR